MSLTDPIDQINIFIEKCKNVDNIADGDYLDELSRLSKTIIDLFTLDIDQIRSDAGSTNNDKTINGTMTNSTAFLTLSTGNQTIKKLDKLTMSKMDTKQRKDSKKKKSKVLSKVIF